MMTDVDDRGDRGLPAQFRALTERLRVGEILEPSELRNAIYDLGNARYFPAKAVIESYLRHQAGEVREAAIVALALDFRSQEHRVTCEEMIDTETDEDTLRSAAAGLGSLLFGTRDTIAMQKLARIVRNSSHDRWTRGGAYSAILSIIGVPPGNHPHVTEDEEEFLANVDWDLISRVERGRPI
jgi:hypothetical protein